MVSVMGSHPYIVHLDAVASLAAGYGDTAMAIAYLHDRAERKALTYTKLATASGIEELDRRCPVTLKSRI